MRTRTCVLFSIFLLVAAVIFISASCDNGASTMSMTGTWINSDYDGGAEGNSGKIVVAHVDGNDYTWTMYVNHDDTEGTVSFTITEESTDSEGNHFFKAVSYPGDPAIYYSYSKVHADGQTMEGNASETGYPTEISPTGEEYFIYYRQ